MISAFSFSLLWLAGLLLILKNKSFIFKIICSLLILLITNIPIIYHLSLNQWILSFTSSLSILSILLALAYIAFSLNLLKTPPLKNFYSNLIMIIFSLLLLVDILGFLPFSIYHHFYMSIVFAGIFCICLFLSNAFLGLLSLLSLASALLPYLNYFQILDTLFDLPLFIFTSFNALYNFRKRL